MAKRELGSPEHSGPHLLGHPCAWAWDTPGSTAPTLSMQGYAAGWLSPALPAAAPVTIKPCKGEVFHGDLSPNLYREYFMGLQAQADQ